MSRLVRLFFLTLTTFIACAHARRGGERASDFTLPELSGRSWNLSSAAGKVVVLDFWATWCGPCKKELPVLAALARRYGAKGKDVLFVAISIDKDRERAAEFVNEAKLDSLIVLHDPEGAVAARYDLPTMPTSYVIDRQGVVRHVHAGFEAGDEDALAAEIDGLLK